MKKDLKVKILCGIPASGKSTWTKEYLAKNPNTVSVSRDDFRYGLRNTGITEPKIEDLITDLVDMTIIKCLNKNLNVIIDATNLKASYINHFIELVKYKASVEFMVFDISLEKCILRDSQRERKVGEHVIKKMYKQYRNLVETYPFQNVPQQPAWKDRFEPLKQDKNLPEAVIFDIDGNLSNLAIGRSPFDWDKVDGDEPIPQVVEHIEMHKNKNRKIILVTGRDEVAREKTEYWLKFYNIYYDELFFRKKDDWRKDYVVKTEIFNDNIRDKYNVIACYDDRMQVIINCWYKIGIFCFTTNQGLKEF